MAQTGSKRAIDVSVDAREFYRVLKMAKDFDSKFHKRLQKDLREAGQVAANAARDEVRKPPPPRLAKKQQTHFSGGRKVVDGDTVTRTKHDLREHITKGIKVRTNASERARRVGVFVVSEGSDKASKALKRHYDSEKGWRHPVFPPKGSSRDTWNWAPQVGRPYFSSVMEKHRPQVEEAVRKALAQAVDDITAAVHK